MQKWLVKQIVLWIFFIPAVVNAAPLEKSVFEKTLSNGLKVIVKEDHRAPVLVQQIWYHAGSMDEITGTTGIAHVLEHMMFKGTKSVPPGEFSRRIAAAGGRENAFTSYDYTAYFQQLHKDKLELAMKLESDRMHNLVLSDAEFAKEIQVVMEERRMRTDDEPHALLSEQLMAMAFEEHPYHHPIIGWMNDLKTLTAADARNWYQHWYTPNNATLVIAGDVKASDVFAMAQRYYGSIPSRALPSRKNFVEPAQLGSKRFTVKAPAELPLLVMAYQAPTLRDPQKDTIPYSLEVLGAVLDGNQSARLNKILVREKQLASNVGAGYDSTARGPSLFTIEGTPSAGVGVAALEAAILEQIAILVRDGISPEELARVKAQVTANEVYKLDSVFYQAMQLGQMESIGLKHQDIPLMLEKIKAVTALQVQEAARDILKNDNLIVGVLDPQALNGKPKRNAGGDTHVR
jgi:zinc protease